MSLRESGITSCIQCLRVLPNSGLVHPTEQVISIPWFAGKMGPAVRAEFHRFVTGVVVVAGIAGGMGRVGDILGGFVLLGVGVFGLVLTFSLPSCIVEYH